MIIKILFFAADSLGLPQVNATPAKLRDILTYSFVILGAISLLVIVLAGVKFITAGGNPEKITKARNTIIYALVGLVVAIFAAVIVSLVIKKTT